MSQQRTLAPGAGDLGPHPSFSTYCLPGFRYVIFTSLLQLLFCETRIIVVSISQVWYRMQGMNVCKHSDGAKCIINIQ